MALPIPKFDLHFTLFLFFVLIKDVEKIEDESLRSSERLKLGSAEDLFGLYEPQDSTYSNVSNVFRCTASTVSLVLIANFV